MHHVQTSKFSLPLTTWFLAIYFITQSKDGLSGLHLRRLLGISVNAAFRMKQKIQHVMKNADDSLRLENLVELDDVYWGGKKKSGKRGRGTAGKTPFIAVVSRNDKGNLVHMRMSKVKAFTYLEIERWIFTIQLILTGSTKTQKTNSFIGLIP